MKGTKSKLQKVGVFAMMCVAYLIITLVIIIGSPIWAYAVITADDNSTQGEAAKRM